MCYIVKGLPEESSKTKADLLLKANPELMEILVNHFPTNMTFI